MMFYIPDIILKHLDAVTNYPLIQPGLLYFLSLSLFFCIMLAAGVTCKRLVYVKIATFDINTLLKGINLKFTSYKDILSNHCKR